MAQDPNNLIWLDMEMSGLDPDRDRILEVAMVVTNLFQVAHRIALSLPDANVKSEGVDLFLAHGEAAGQDVFHVHLHVIPRYDGDGFGLTFGPNYRTLPERVALDAIAAQIKQQLEK